MPLVMIRPASRALLRSTARSTNLASARSLAGRRFISTDPPHLKSRSWKNSALRWGLAAAGIYYYNTSPVFAEEPQYNLLNPNVDALEDDTTSTTLDALTASSRRKSEKDASVLQSAVENVSERAARPDVVGDTTAHPQTDIPAIEGSPSDLEEEAEGQGAFNPVTGEINWDCPCLGGMAHGPCGPEFRDAFSCFVYSTEEPKGMDCIDKFQNMQTCFRAHPEVYKAELEDDEELDAELAQEKEELKTQIAERKAAEREREQVSGNRLLEEPGTTAPAEKTPKKASKKVSKDAAPSNAKPHVSSEDQSTQPTANHNTTPAEAVVPKAAHDNTDAPVPRSSKA